MVCFSFPASKIIFQNLQYFLSLLIQKKPMSDGSGANVPETDHGAPPFVTAVENSSLGGAQVRNQLY